MKAGAMHMVKLLKGTNRQSKGFMKRQAVVDILARDEIGCCQQLADQAGTPLRVRAKV